MLERGISRFFVEKLLSHSAEEICRTTLSYFKKFLVTNNFMVTGGGGGSIMTLRRKFFVSQYRKTLNENPSVFQKLYGIEELYEQGTGGVSRFPVNFFCLTVPKKLRRGIL